MTAQDEVEKEAERLCDIYIANDEDCLRDSLSYKDGFKAGAAFQSDKLKQLECDYKMKDEAH